MLGNIVGDGLSFPKEICLSEQGKVAQQFLLDLSEKYPCANVDKHIVMPNHIHMILALKNATNNLRNTAEDSIGSGTGNPSPTVGAIIGWYKYRTTIQINAFSENEVCKFWQRSFYDHIIRNDEEYQDIYNYIETNPSRWEYDSLFSDIQVQHL